MSVGAFIKICVLAAFGGTGAIAMEQGRNIVVDAVDGRNGRPLANQRLVAFAGESPESVKRQRSLIELVTDKDGLATLTIAAPDLRWVQVWADGHILCQSEPNGRSFSVLEVLSNGVSAPNTCGTMTKKTEAGHLVIFARPANFWEKMRR